MIKRLKRRLSYALKVLLGNPSMTFGLVVLAIFVTCAIFSPWIAPHDPLKMDLTNSFQPPGSNGHLLGTDNYGRDIFSRLIYGSRVSLLVGLVVISISSTFGSLLGLLSGYYGGVVDMVIMRLVEVIYSFPFLILAVAVMAVLGPSIFNIMLVLSVSTWPLYARLVQPQVMSIREREFVQAARGIGAGSLRIMVIHLLPNCFSSIIVTATMQMATAILSTAALSFLGLGVQPPAPEWGLMLNQGKPFLRRAPFMIMYPGVAIMLLVLSLNLIGDGLRDILDPQLSRMGRI
ncbi:ABC transporter permease [Candidatus Bipolaricaulota bacterium]|nr:ABC transporter permease [Candidatus Bipolaricaulota bacterium]